MDREDPYEKPEDNLDDMDNICTTNFRYSQIPRLQTEIRTIQADLNQVQGESLEGEGYGFIFNSLQPGSVCERAIKKGHIEKGI